MSEEEKAVSRARYAVYYAIKKGTLVRPRVCELCGCDIDKKEAPSPFDFFSTPDQLRKGGHRIVAHHWRGYEYPLDVWFVCHKCNLNLSGFHNGLLSKEKAIIIARHHWHYWAKIRVALMAGDMTVLESL